MNEQQRIAILQDTLKQRRLHSMRQLAALQERNPGISKAQLARMAGCSESTVARMRRWLRAGKPMD